MFWLSGSCILKHKKCVNSERKNNFNEVILYKGHLYNTNLKLESDVFISGFVFLCLFRAILAHLQKKK